MDETSGVALALKTGVPIYQVEDGGSTELADLSAIASEKEEVLRAVAPPPSATA
jgi:hypothetical protein